MDSTPPLPPRPQPAEKPRGSCLMVLAVTAAALGAIAFTLLMIGFIWPIVVGLAIFAIIGLQYLVWGWWFEKIYRSDNTRQD